MALRKARQTAERLDEGGSQEGRSGHPPGWSKRKVAHAHFRTLHSVPGCLLENCIEGLRRLPGGR